MSLPSAKATDCLYDHTFGSSIEAVGWVCEDLQKAAVNLGLSRDTLFKIGLLAHEFMSNAVIHGNEKRPEKKVHVRLSAPKKVDFVRLVITDEGPGFAWKKAAGTAIPSDRAVSGRGLAIGTLYAKKITWNSRGNSVTLTIPIERPGNQENGNIEVSSTDS